MTESAPGPTATSSTAASSSAAADRAAADRAADQVGPVGIDGLVRRVRRIAGLSQRQLADRLCVSQSRVSRMEKGVADVSISQLQGLLAVAQLRLAVLDPNGVEVVAMRSDAVRDNGGRRLPAHLDPQLPSETDLWIAGMRKDRSLPKVTFRRPGGTRPAPSPRQDDHPTPDDLAERRQRRDRERQAAFDARHRPAPVALPDCFCDEERCVLECVPDCECNCWFH